jgi:hypothetical protein
MKRFLKTRANHTDLSVLLTMCLSLVLLADAPVWAPAAVAADTPDESPHWSKSACSTCHANPAPTDASDVRLDDHSKLCLDCHGETAPSNCPHPTNLPTQHIGDLKLPESYRSALVDDRIVCTSCHAVKLQCTGGRLEQYQNPAFLRDGPSRQGQACFDCHDTKRYKKLNPHTRVSDGQTQACLFCHNDVPDPEKITRTEYRESGNVQCTGCHKTVPHPLSVPGAITDEWTHLVVPTPEILTRMQATEGWTGIRLPLDPVDGAIRCTTCHNVHDPDLADYPLQTDEGTASKLRMLDICEACHDK